MKALMMKIRNMRMRRPEKNLIHDKKSSLRKCVGCGIIKEKSKFIRIMNVHNSDEVIIEPTSRYFGRSSYLCYNRDCLKNAVKKKRLQKSLKKTIEDSILKNLENIISEYTI
jgi:predicted RNA-binding protein YlxR (DUF448 family)